MADLLKFLLALERIGQALNPTQDDYILVPPLIEKENHMPTTFAPAFVPTLTQHRARRTRTAGREHLRVRALDGHVINDGTQPRYVAEWIVWHVAEDGTPTRYAEHGTFAGVLHHLPRLLAEGGVHDAA